MTLFSSACTILESAVHLYKCPLAPLPAVFSEWRIRRTVPTPQQGPPVHCLSQRVRSFINTHQELPWRRKLAHTAACTRLFAIRARTYEALTTRCGGYLPPVRASVASWRGFYPRPHHSGSLRVAHEGGVRGGHVTRDSPNACDRESAPRLGCCRRRACSLAAVSRTRPCPAAGNRGGRQRCPRTPRLPAGERRTSNSGLLHMVGEFLRV